MYRLPKILIARAWPPNREVPAAEIAAATHDLKDAIDFKNWVKCRLGNPRHSISPVADLQALMSKCG
jgi:hypothetical protein